MGPSDRRNLAVGCRRTYRVAMPQDFPPGEPPPPSSLPIATAGPREPRPPRGLRRFRARWLALLGATLLAMYLCWLMLQPFVEVLLWAVVRTGGLPFGLADTESIGLIDTVATAAELMAVVAGAAALLPRRALAAAV